VRPGLPLALVVPHGDAFAPSELLASANARLGKQQRLVDGLVGAELRRNPNGKILKRELREEYGDKSYA
jgi:acyl-CoA synthetase (AMP-forming)/AMP-acid ligase II